MQRDGYSEMDKGAEILIFQYLFLFVLHFLIVLGHHLWLEKLDGEHRDQRKRPKTLVLPLSVFDSLYSILERIHFTLSFNSSD